MHLDLNHILTYDDDSENKTKGTKKYVVKRILKFNVYENYLFKNGIILKLHKVEKWKTFYTYWTNQ